MNAREDQLTEAFVELADSLVAGFEVADFLHRLIERVLELLDADAAGIMLADGNGTLQVLASSSHVMETLELYELQGESGPCLDAFRSGEPVTPPDLAAMRGSWPEFTAQAEAAGYSSVQAIPMRLREEVIGALNVFRRRAGALTDGDLKLGRALADVATVALITERTMTARQLLADQLQEALVSRVLLEQAKGMLAERAGIDPGAAFELMRTRARRSGTTLLDVARAVVATRGTDLGS